MSTTSVINQVVESVIDMMNTRSPFQQVTRGALPTHEGIACEIGPTMYGDMHMDKRLIVPLDLTINGKHPDLRTLSDTLNGLCGYLTFLREYPADPAGRWQIVDITNGTLPQVIGREENNDWLMACSITIKFYWRGE